MHKLFLLGLCEECAGKQLGTQGALPVLHPTASKLSTLPFWGKNIFKKKWANR